MASRQEVLDEYLKAQVRAMKMEEARDELVKRGALPAKKRGSGNKEKTLVKTAAQNILAAKLGATISPAFASPQPDIGARIRYGPEGETEQEHIIAPNDRFHINDPTHPGVYDIFLQVDDAFCKSQVTLASGLMSVDLTNYPGNTTMNGNVGIPLEIKNIISVEVVPFYIPDIAGVNFVLFNRITMAIQEINTMTTRTIGNNYHFAFSVGAVDASGRRLLTPIYPHNSKYIFYKPYNYIDKCTLQFNLMGNSSPIPLPIASYTNATLTVPGLNPAEINIPGHNLVTGQTITILGFSSPNAAVNAAMMIYSGLVVTVTGVNTFTVPVDTTSILAAIPAFTVIIENNRIIVPLQFRGWSDVTTNFIVAT